jgi:hypothetical protein
MALHGPDYRAMAGKTSENGDWARASLAFARHLGLLGDDGRYGPGNFVSLIPSSEADDLAFELASRALDPLRRAAVARDLFATVNVFDIDEGKRFNASLRADLEVSQIDPGAFTLGLPLLGSICPSVLEVALERLIPMRLRPQERPNRPARADLAFHLVMTEADLWAIATRHGFPWSAMPYATRVRALRWWWEPRPGREKRPALCVRCGELMFTRALRSRSPAPLCDRCVKSPSLERRGAIAPAGRGTWWLWCQAEGCSNAFEGRAQARCCPRHRSSRLSPSRRR